MIQSADPLSLFHRQRPPPAFRYQPIAVRRIDRRDPDDVRDWVFSLATSRIAAYNVMGLQT